MIIGNPNNFAIFIDVITEWNYTDPYWVEGAFDFIFQNNFFSKKINYYTLAEFYLQNTEGKHSVYFLEQSPPIDKEIFFMEKEEAFIEMISSYNPYIFNEDEEDDDDDYSKLTDKFLLFYPSSSGFWVTFVAYNNQIRILAAQTEYLSPIIDNTGNWLRNEWKRIEKLDIKEAIIDIHDFKLIKSKLNLYFDEINKKFFRSS